MYKSNPFIVRMVALLVLPALLVVEPAFAASAAQAPPSVTVRFNDLNLDRKTDIANLYGRIETAATEVCKSTEGPQSVSRMHWTAWNECFYHAIAKAVLAVHNDKLSAYHWQRIGGWNHGDPDSLGTVARR
jgi:UrcA family protein